MKTSVLICTWNRGELIHETLKSLIESSSVAADEIIVVNGGGEKDCSSTLAYWKSRCNHLKEIKTVNINLANSRNIGLKECSGDIILLTDDDAKPFPNWIEQIIDAHTKYPQAGAIGGEVIDASGKNFVSKIADLTTFPFHSETVEVNNLPGVNCSYKKEVVAHIGEQDLTMFRGEDVDYNWRIHKAGWKILYVPEIKVYHFHRPTWKGLFNQHHMYGRAYYRVRKKWPEMYSTYPHHLKSFKMWLKLFYLAVLPLHFAFQKAKQTKGILNKILFFIIIFFLSCYTMLGTFIQMGSDTIFNKQNH